MNSYKNIAKSSGIIGLVQVFQIVFGLIRNKAIAILVGAQGFGIWGLYNTYIEMVSQISILGLDQSGVRQIAKNSDNKNYLYKCIYIFKQTILVVSILSTILSILFSKSISKAIFNSEDYYIGVIIASFVILFNGISKGQRSILNGLHDIKGLAISQIVGAIIGSIVAIIAVYLFGINGIPMFIFAVGLSLVGSTWWFVRKLNIKKEVPSIVEYKSELKKLISLGLGFGIAGIIASIMTYFSRLYLTNTFNIEAVGIYQASWTISNLYIGTILSAMGVDLMPRLAKVSDDNKEINRLVNEQMELGMLVASIVVVAILVFSPIILNLLYSKEFLVGTTIIRWQVLGVSLRVLAFPFSYAIMAKGKSVIYITVQSIFWIGEFLLLVLFSKLFGFDGLGINYFIGYIGYFLMSLFACVKIFNYHPSIYLQKITLISYLFIGGAFFLCIYTPQKISISIGLLLLITHVLIIYFQLKRKMNIDILFKFKRGKKIE